uniref:Uncharacterized protein MANES_03G021300 n=1 Tax=Rhizophora mucronata TaxID=61149 RepID=A0A2P2JU40_RHIMU
MASMLSYTASLASNSTTEFSTSSKLALLFKKKNHSKPNPELKFPSLPSCCCQSGRIVALSSRSRQSVGGADGSAAQFLGNNSIADFLRFKRGSDGGGGGGGSELQTAVVSYRKRFPWSILQPFFRVDLISTIHIADKEYFETLQKELETYDCILYEMVASRESLKNRRNPDATRCLKGSRSKRFSIIGFIQRLMAQILMLDFQLDCLDYQAENWYHADLDYETFKLLQVTLAVPSYYVNKMLERI